MTGLDGLDDEELLAMLSVRFSAGLPINLDTRHNPTGGANRPSVVQRYAYAHWTHAAAAAGFPIAGPEMIVGITPTRLLVWKPALIRSRPRRYAGSIQLTRVQTASVHRKLLSSVLTLLFENGAIVGVETLRGSKLRGFATAIPTYSGPRSR